MARMTVSVDEDTRQQLIKLAEGERKIGAYINDLVAAEVKRQSEWTWDTLCEQVMLNVHTLGMLYERVGDLEYVAEKIVCNFLECPVCGKKLDLDGRRLTCYHCGIDVETGHNI